MIGTLMSPQHQAVDTQNLRQTEPGVLTSQKQQGVGTQTSGLAESGALTSALEVSELAPSGMGPKTESAVDQKKARAKVHRVR